MAEPEYDLILRGGTVLDGTGGPAFRADVGVCGARITAVGDLSTAQARRVLDASGLRVVPGFLDIHTHSDISATYHPEQSSAVAMGVTTQVVGNCGLSMGLALRTDVFGMEQRWLAAHRAQIVWGDFAEYLQFVEGQGIGTNVLSLVGHGTLRKRVMGMADRAPDAAELRQMQRVLEDALEAGAWGLSSGLEYPPSAFAGEEELVALCRVVAGGGGLYATHLRNEGDTLIEAVQEALRVGERAGVAVQLSHHKAEGERNHGKVRTTLRMIEEARERGLDVQTDQYPYPAYMTALAIQTLPRWALRGSDADMVARLRDPATRTAIREEMARLHPEWEDARAGAHWDRVRIGICRGRPEIQGRSVRELAAEAGAHPMDYVLGLLEETEGHVSAINFSIDEGDIVTVLRYRWTAIGSDGVATRPEGATVKDMVHPRSYGTFPRVLGRYVREEGVLSEAEAVHRMTGLPAARLGLTDRGRIAAGCFADITVYDPERVADRATFEDPHRYPEGIVWVIVNGQVALEGGEPLGVRAGRVLRRGVGAGSGGVA
ncbi:MAG: D-aminoacylase [Chloroherpetonaceae bacterium]|nr:D-aminoacylase [Chthonomonadaceae bacterium]MDW8209258.1 D-aminoacylase [Chloroherpetonaceae bacterium]